ncbi:putative bifunctional diguanylate cyclase/phosphodiesterase [Mycobacterium sp. pW049]|uniref:putative bifunctional diguanylate cyclase/phosphodiesterase n=1 Tax=[Mycobacterium] bulgaricum TaxID=3238985 RepID=UPI00351B2E4F
MMNAFAFWGDETAFKIDSVLQVCTAAVAVVYGLIVARRVNGSARTWRLLAVGAVICLTVGEIAWWNRAGGLPASTWVTSYWLFLFLATASVVVLAVAARGVEVPADSSLRHLALITVLDGGVAAASFALLVIVGRFGAFSTFSWPQSGHPAVEIAYAVGQLVLVVFAAVVGMMYSADRPYRSNYLQLACGFVVIVASDRVVAYFDSVGAPYAQSWGGIGVVLGPLFIALSMRERRERSVTTKRFRPMDWAQLILPYTGFLGITILLSYHVLTGHILDAVVVSTTLVMVILVAARQIAAMGAQRLLTRRLYEAQRGLAHQVLHDALTGLPNRLLFAQRLDQAMRDGGFVLIFVDLDDFKEVNDRFGHAAGDELLCAVGERLKRSITTRDTLARIGGDEFAILIAGDHEMPEVVADRLRVALREPFPVHGSSVRVRASMGLVRSGDQGNAQTSDDLLRQADISMYAGKRLGKNTAVVYQPTAGVRAEFPAALREALGGVPAGFSLAYQPVVRLDDESLVAVEALARWTAPNGIVIPPETFVAVAESAGLGATLDALVLDLACREVEEAGLGEMNIHVNVGAARLGNLGFEEQVRNTLSHCAMDPHRLVLEITETLPIVDLDDAAAQIRRFNEIGVRMALDDFGAGYNSLTYLHALPVQIVKLDRSLAVGSDPDRDLALYRSVIGLCSDLGLDVVAEGIETRLQADTVHTAGCQYAQGHLFGKPVPMSVLSEEWKDRIHEHAPQVATGRCNRD